MVWISRAPNSKTNIKVSNGLKEDFDFFFKLLTVLGHIYLPLQIHLCYVHYSSRFLGSRKNAHFDCMLPSSQGRNICRLGRRSCEKNIVISRSFFSYYFLIWESGGGVECGGHHIWNMFLGGHSMCATNSQALTFDKPTTKSSRKRIGFFCDSKGQAKNQVSAT